jgi:very-short-patch-repair endonuclease
MGNKNPAKRPEVRKKMSISHKKLWKNPEYRANFIEKMKGKQIRLGSTNSKVTKKKISKSQKKIWKRKGYRQKMSLAHKNQFFSKECREKISITSKKRWQDPKYRKKAIRSMKEIWKDKEYKERRVKTILKASQDRPTQLEQRFDAFFKQNNLPFHYVGDGQLIIGGKNPDFVCNPSKLVIETASKRHKREFRGMSWQSYQRKRKAHFKKYFFDCICLWEDELKKPQKIMNKIFRITLLKGGLRK